MGPGSVEDIDNARVYSYPTAQQSYAGSGTGNVDTGAVWTYAPGSSGNPPLLGVAASVDISGTRHFTGEPPTPWSAHASAIASSQTGRVELQAGGVPFTYDASSYAWMFAYTTARAGTMNGFAPEFSREVAAALGTIPQYLTLTATLTGRTASPGLVTGSLLAYSDFFDPTTYQELEIAVDAAGEWTRQYQLQYRLSTLVEYVGQAQGQQVFYNCLEAPSNWSWARCVSTVRFETSFNIGTESTSSDTNELSVLLSWSVPDTVLSLATDAANWGAPLAVDLPVATVPEPGSAAMVLLGIGVLAGVQGRRRTLGVARRAASGAS